MTSVVFPGTFDPPTHGHVDIIKRASRAFDLVYVLIAINPNKEALFSLEERKALLETLVAPLPNIRVVIWEAFVADFMSERGVHLIVRGVRGLQDFGAEFEMHLVNHSLNQVIDTVWFPASSNHLEVSSSVVKMLVKKKKDVLSFVPETVARAMEEKLGSSN